ncbi:GNAT family N-acetyltransferase [Candidatus Bathyarchaeota archaeon]|nr:GNAT family N-acetyltransferase [Candidatus Bathyarchaeota archaeon]
MQIYSREYQHNNDFEAVMHFLRESYSTTKSFQNWLPTRFENNSREKGIQIWLDATEKKEKIIALSNPEEKFRYFIQLNPNYQFLFKEILHWIEKNCINQKQNADEKQTLSIINLESSLNREEELKKQGFQKEKIYGILRLRNLNSPIPNFSIPNGYEIRSVNPSTDFEELAKAVRIVFNHGEWFNKEILQVISRASFYHKELDLVMVNKKGKIASFCTFRFDAPSGITELEPMGTLPEYRRKGLAKALLCEGFRRLQKYNPKLLYIDGAADTPEANRLYEVTGFTETQNYYFWNKII